MKKIEHAMNEEKNKKIRIETNMSAINAKVLEVEERLVMTGEAARENKSALSQLISHTKNVERAVTMNQKDVVAKKDAHLQK